MKGIMNTKLNFCFTVALAIMLLFSCQKELTITEALKIIPTKNATVKRLQFSLSDSAEVKVRLKNLKTNLESYIISSKNTSHELLLAGLKPDQAYSLDLLENDQTISQIDSFHTSPIEENIVRIFERINSKNTFDGYILTQRRLVNGSVYMLDNESELVWYQMVGGQPKLSKWIDAQELLVLVGNAKHNNSAGDQIVSYTIDGEIDYQIDLNALGLVAHHEILEHDGDLFTLVYDSIPYTVNGVEDKAVSSAVVRLSKKGEVKWKWSTFDIQKPVDVPIKEMDGDWGHANSFDFDEDGNLIISYRDWNQIWKIDIKTGKRVWVLGYHGDFEIEDLAFSGQHAVHKNPQGDYMIIDNGRDRRQTRVVSYRLNDNKAEQVVTINLPDDLYTDKMGNVETLPNGNYLVCSPRSRSILVLNPSGEIVYHINTGIPDPYRASFVPSFYSKR